MRMKISISRIHDTQKEHTIMKQIIFILSIILTTAIASMDAQTVEHSWQTADFGGGYATANGFSLSSSIGYLASASETSDGVHLASGYIAAAGVLAGDITHVERIGAAREYVLLQNYPNPFSASAGQSTTILFSLQKTSKITLEVYNLLGKKISTLADARADAGSYEVRFDAVGLESGVYLYQLTVDNVRYSRTMTLLK